MALSSIGATCAQSNAHNAAKALDALKIVTVNGHTPFVGVNLLDDALELSEQIAGLLYIFERYAKDGDYPLSGGIEGQALAGIATLASLLSLNLTAQGAGQ